MTTATPIRMTDETTDRPALFLAFALGAKQWKLGAIPAFRSACGKRRGPQLKAQWS